MGSHLTGRKILTHNNTLQNLCRGVGERVLFTNSRLDKPIKPERSSIFEDRLHHYRDQLVSSLGFQSPVAREEFPSFYTGHRRKVYDEAVAGLALLPFRPRDANLKTFVKSEKIVEGLKCDPVPRVIQPRTPRYNVEVGRFLRPLEKKMYKAIDLLFESPTIMSEYNAFTQAAVLFEKWNKFKMPACVGLDASRFDQHVSVPALKFEHSIYNRIFKSKELARLLTFQIKNAGYAVASDGEFEYRVRGSRMSGDMNTSLGNKLLMTLMCRAFIETTHTHIELANNGDDCLLIMEKSDLSKIQNLIKYFEEFGFKLVLEKPVYEFEQIEFCQTSPCMANGVYRMIRNVKTCLAKDMACTNMGWRLDEFRHWLYDVGSCGLASAADVPILGKFYSKLKTIGNPGNYNGKYNQDFKWYWASSRDARCSYNSSDSYSRYSFWLSSGITPDEQVSIENQIDHLNWGDDMRQHIESNIHYLLK